tara:strand:+ start:295 stop:831 length:537 start_codon:yes stop_codon:yes gene_type:complete
MNNTVKIVLALTLIIVILTFGSDVKPKMEAQPPAQNQQLMQVIREMSRKTQGVQARQEAFIEELKDMEEIIQNEFEEDDQAIDVDFTTHFESPDVGGFTTNNFNNLPTYEALADIGDAFQTWFTDIKPLETPETPETPAVANIDTDRQSNQGMTSRTSTQAVGESIHAHPTSGLAQQQ